MSESTIKRSVQKAAVEFLFYHGFESGEKTVNKGTVTQKFSWEAKADILVSLESNTKARTAKAHLTFFNSDGSLSTLEDKRTVDLNTEEDVESFRDFIAGYMAKTPWRKSQSGTDFFASLVRDGRQVDVYSLNRLLK